VVCFFSTLDLFTSTVRSVLIDQQHTKFAPCYFTLDLDTGTVDSVMIDLLHTKQIPHLLWTWVHTGSFISPPCIITFLLETITSGADRSNHCPSCLKMYRRQFILYVTQLSLRPVTRFFSPSKAIFRVATIFGRKKEKRNEPYSSSLSLSVP